VKDKTVLLSLDLFKGCSSFHAEDHRPILDSIQDAAEIDPGRLFVQIGIGDARSTVSLIGALNELGLECTLLSIDSHPSAKFAWESLCSGLRGPCLPRFRETFSQAIDCHFSFYGPSWLLISGCPCYKCTRAHLKDWVHRVSLDGFLLMNTANEETEGVRIPSPYHLKEGRVDVCCGVLRGAETAHRIRDEYDPWRPDECRMMKIWRRQR